MDCQICIMRECLLTLVTAVRSFSRMNKLMAGQIPFLREALPTLATVVWPLSSVDVLVKSTPSTFAETLPTLDTDMSHLFSVDRLSGNTLWILSVAVVAVLFLRVDWLICRAFAEAAHTLIVIKCILEDADLLLWMEIRWRLLNWNYKNWGKSLRKKRKNEYFKIKTLKCMLCWPFSSNWLTILICSVAHICRYEPLQSNVST